jgi:DNA-binding NarL/FixJ family response regulator
VLAPISRRSNFGFHGRMRGGKRSNGDATCHKPAAVFESLPDQRSGLRNSDPPATAPIGVTVLAEASNGADAVALARTEDVDLVIQDVAMPGMTGLHAAREIARRTPHPPILMLSMYNEQYFSEGLKAGASEYLLISVADQDLVQACH